MATLLGLIVFPAFALLDLSQLDHIRELMGVRLAMTLVFAVAYLLARKGIMPGGVTATATTLLLLSSAAITAMCAFTGGFASPYYAGINLLILTCVTFPPGTFRETVAACVGVVLTYALGLALFGGPAGREMGFVLNNILFMGATCAIGISTALFQERIRYESFLRLVDAEQADTVRKAHAAVLRAIGIRDEFMSIASHELRTPVTSMKLQNDIMRRKVSEPGAADFVSDPNAPRLLRQWTERNAKSLDRLIRLIEDMLDVARINTGRLKFERSRMDLGECVREVAERFAIQFDLAGIRADFRVEDGIEGEWDRFRVEQIVANFFSNAVKYAPDQRLEVVVERRGDFGVVRVVDHGVGVPAESRERVFERFERAHSSMGATGLGLGLYISRKIAEGHGGRTWVEESPGGGSTFVVSLPLELPNGTRRPGLLDEVHQSI